MYNKEIAEHIKDAWEEGICDGLDIDDVSVVDYLWEDSIAKKMYDQLIKTG